ncbi:hypothetical protein B0T44_23550 [Nocardia donostiensis]|uniref:Luciferase-like domain-containing protein n=2 Tax=Nocardia donostiensis TaxID=1538463 RepID=A0A1W0B5E2_9NOCA|nr:hypothetical protein B0T46_14490 [Nocardia donostiensis]OQS13823.1 hypothetical protein B0T36_16890 [Nocardia donostiensis]OQS17699.1 hypothetical protein B0T44_23550 [Nocardia donostiensis]
MPGMRFGVYVPSYGPYGDPRVLRDLAIAAENAGWHGFFVYDVISPLDDEPPPVADPWVVLSAIAQVTTTIALGPMVVPLPRRRLWKLALEIGTLQQLSGGRLILGVGAGGTGGLHELRRVRRPARIAAGRGRWIAATALVRRGGGARQ